MLLLCAQLLDNPSFIAIDRAELFRHCFSLMDGNVLHVHNDLESLLRETQIRDNGNYKMQLFFFFVFCDDIGYSLENIAESWSNLVDITRQGKWITSLDATDTTDILLSHVSSLYFAFVYSMGASKSQRIRTFSEWIHLLHASMESFDDARSISGSTYLLRNSRPIENQTFLWWNEF